MNPIFIRFEHSSNFFKIKSIFSADILFIVGDSTDQEYEITADMMVHDLDDETTMDEEELLADKEEFNEDELSELQKVVKIENSVQSLVLSQL